VVLALVFAHEGRGTLAVLMAALASVQNAPLLLLAGLLWWRARGDSGRLRAALALLPGFWPVAFYLWHYGRPSLLGEVGGVAFNNMSLSRLGELFFDLNVGMLPYVPLALLGAVAAPVVQLLCHRPARPLLESWGILLAMGLACTATANWNHGTAGPSRYAIWLLPVAFDLLVRMLEPGFAAPAARAVFGGLVVLALVSQLAIVISRGGMNPQLDHLAPSAAAAFVLRHAPSLYNPSEEIFVERTLHREIRGGAVPEGAPVIYRPEGRCLKVLTQKRYWNDVLAACGSPPKVPDFRARVEREGRNAWIYVDY
jgi:hypothetical protein